MGHVDTILLSASLLYTHPDLRALCFLFPKSCNMKPLLEQLPKLGATAFARFPPAPVHLVSKSIPLFCLFSLLCPHRQRVVWARINKEVLTKTKTSKQKPNSDVLALFPLQPKEISKFLVKAGYGLLPSSLSAIDFNLHGFLCRMSPSLVSTLCLSSQIIRIICLNSKSDHLFLLKIIRVGGGGWV